MKNIVNFILLDSPIANRVIESRNNQPKAIENIIRDINIMDEPPFYTVLDEVWSWELGTFEFKYSVISFIKILSFLFFIPCTLFQWQSEQIVTIFSMSFIISFDFNNSKNLYLSKDSLKSNSSSYLSCKYNKISFRLSI